MTREQEIKEAIDMLEGLQYNIMDEIGFHYKGYVCCKEEMHKYDKDFDSIKQSLLKAQENARSEEILQKYYQEGITLDSVRALKQERDNYKKIFEIIKEKRVNVDLFWNDFVDNGFCYHYYLEKWYKYQSTDKQKLTEEEFNLLREVLK